MADTDIMQWCHEMGETIFVAETPVDKIANPVQEAKAKPQTKTQAEAMSNPSSLPPPETPAPPTKHQGMFVQQTAQPPAQTAQELANSAQTLEELKQIMLQFEGCALKKTAKNLVFADGNPKADVMLIGEAPGADEDQTGLPFVGRSGKLLDKMMATIGLDRTTFYISNIIPWRPPGNRPPTSAETATCLPFIDRHISLANPKIIVMVGGTAAKSLLGSTDGITNLRGRFSSYQPVRAPETIDTYAIYHPSYLLRSPGQKRKAWHDLIVLKHRLQKMGIELDGKKARV
ncbi:MAG: uracil-DNA glycosylase [Pseudomonadota bacterium]